MCNVLCEQRPNFFGTTLAFCHCSLILLCLFPGLALRHTSISKSACFVTCLFWTSFLRFWISLLSAPFGFYHACLSSALACFFLSLFLLTFSRLSFFVKSVYFRFIINWFSARLFLLHCQFFHFLYSTKRDTQASTVLSLLLSSSWVVLQAKCLYRLPLSEWQEDAKEGESADTR